MTSFNTEACQNYVMPAMRKIQLITYKKCGKSRNNKKGNGQLLVAVIGLN